MSTLLRGPDPDERAIAVHDMFAMMDEDVNEELSACQIQAAHEMIRMGGISIAQVKASMLYTCIDPNVCEEWEFLDLLKEMDRRYYLIQDFRWEFSMLDANQTDSITEDQARWFLQSVHGDNFSRSRWDSFTKSRPAPGSKVCFAEIEVDLCNIPCSTDILDEEADERKRMEEEERRKRLAQEERKKMKEKLEQDRLRMLEEQKQIQAEKDKLTNEKKRQEELEEEKKRREEEKDHRKREKEDEDRRKVEEQEQLEKLRHEAEEKRKKAEEEATNIEAIAKEAADAEAEAERAAAEAHEQLQRADDGKSRKELEEREAEAVKRRAEMKEKKIRANLKVSIKKRKRAPLKRSVNEFKTAKLDDYDGDVPVAERLLKLATAKDRLKDAMAIRDIKKLEDSMNHVKNNGFEQELQPEMIEANQLLLRLRRLERIRAEILELKQSTVAEIRSYSSPPVIVHSVMIATFLLIGHNEKETKEWKKVQALVGKTGKEGLKRRCLEYDPQSLVSKMDIATKAKNKMAAFELDEVRDVSAGAATFYLWASNMIEEAEMMEVQNRRDKENKENNDDDDC